MDDREIRDQLMTLLIAGHETTATGLAWSIDLLVASPRRAGARPDAAGDTYLRAVVSESLRLRPVVPLAGRRLAADLNVDGLSIPAGTDVTPAIWLAHTRAAGVSGAVRVPARAVPRAARRRPTPGCRSAAACAGASARRSRSSRCASCSTRSCRGSTCVPRGGGASAWRGETSPSRRATGRASSRAGVDYVTTIFPCIPGWIVHSKL